MTSSFYYTIDLLKQTEKKNPTFLHLRSHFIILTASPLIESVFSAFQIKTCLKIKLRKISGKEYFLCSESQFTWKTYFNEFQVFHTEDCFSDRRAVCLCFNGLTTAQDDAALGQRLWKLLRWLANTREAFSINFFFL